MAWNLPDLPTDNVTIASVANWATKVIDSLRYLKGLDGDITLEDDIITTHLVDGVDVNAHKARHEAAGGDALSAPVAIAAMPALTDGYVWKGDATNRPAEVAFPTRTLSAANDTVTEGYYAATTLSTVDPDLTPANILSGITIFGKAGTLSLTVTEEWAADNTTSTTESDWVTKRQVTVTGNKIMVWIQFLTANNATSGYTRILVDDVEKLNNSGYLSVASYSSTTHYIGAGGVVKFQIHAAGGNPVTGRSGMVSFTGV